VLSLTTGWSALGVATVGGCAAGLLIGLRLAAMRRPRGDAGALSETATARRIEDHLASGQGRLPSFTPSQLRTIEQHRADREDAEAEIGLLNGTLRDVRDASEADEAIFWRWVESRDSLAPAAWSTAAARPQFFRLGDWGPLAQWTAQEQRIQHDASEGIARLASVPVVRGDRLLGVLTLSRESGFPGGAGPDDEALLRHARQIGTILDLGEIRRDYGRHMRQSRALLQAVGRIHVHKTPESLSRAICETAVEVTSAQWAALVRWSSDEGIGVVQHATDGLGVRAFAAVSEQSMIASVCHEGLPVVMEDATAVHAHAAVFGPGERLVPFGSLAIVPLYWGAGPIGAIAIAAEGSGAITHEEARNLGLLGAVAATSLEIVWENEEVNKRANTDPLTGLANRRHFDDSLQRVLSETDRFGATTSLILVDIDHFKKVNDTYGHDAGDAVLRAVARTLAEGCRTVDVCARFGGEEMALLLPHTLPDGAFELADRLRRAIAERVVRHGTHEISVTASFGVAAYPDCSRSRDGLFPAADKALYEAKRDGRNRVKAAMLIPASATV
jgi:diguanylate cyclase (GGDEF)-like protein